MVKGAICCYVIYNFTKDIPVTKYTFFFLFLFLSFLFLKVIYYKNI